MTANETTVQYGVTDAFLDNLDRLAHQATSWWRDVLLRDDVFIAVRLNSLNVYHRGASIFQINDIGGGKVGAKTHVKYLVRQEQRLAELMDDNRFLPDNIGWSHYKGPNNKGPNTLDDMIRSAADLSGVEKTGLHPLVLGSSNVVDVEVSLLGPIDPESDDDALSQTVQSQILPKSSRDQERLDVATLEQRDNTTYVVFHEAKHFSNSALRAKAEPSVIGQMVRYGSAIAHHQAALKHRYRAVCAAMVRLHEMRRDVRKGVIESKPPANLNDMISDVVAKNVDLQIDPVPRLIVFGFDGDQRDGRWKGEKERLEHFMPGIKIKAIGNTKSARNFF